MELKEILKEGNTTKEILSSPQVDRLMNGEGAWDHRNCHPKLPITKKTNHRKKKKEGKVLKK